jgi:DNA-binding response OmpR family regulator
MDAILQGRLILVVEDQPIVALDIAHTFLQAGATVLRAATLQEGLSLAEHPQLTAAILDFGLGAEDAAPLCARLSERSVPFVIYTGYGEVPAACRNGIVVQKPAPPHTLLAALTQLLGE